MRNSLNAAQKVRLWFMLAALVIGFISMIISLSETGMEIDGTWTMPISAWNGLSACMFLVFASIVALAVLGPITLYRFLHPIAQPPSGHPQTPYAAHPQTPYRGNPYTQQSPYPPTQQPPYGQV